MRKITLFILDIIVFYAALLVTLAIRYRGYDEKFGYWLNLHLVSFSIIFTVWLLVFYIAGLYEPRHFRNNAQFYSVFFRSITIAGSISVFFFYLIPFLGITPKTNLVLLIAIFTLLELGNRRLFNGIAEKKFKRPTLIASDNQQTSELAQFIKDNPQLGYDLKQVVDVEKIRTGELERLILQDKINTVVIGPEAYQSPEIINIFYKSLGQKITFYSLASFYERLTGRVPLGAIDQVWFLENLSEGNKMAYETAKRFMDAVFAAILGTISLVFYPFLILAVKLNSRGPVFYKQKRIGQIGKTFEMLKFRTMRQDAEQLTGAVWAADNDPRATRVGGFLRKTRLDELPQLWNIIKGEMSFVGPRAERPEFHEILKKEIPFYEERYLIKPGLSGWAQINFRYGSSVKDAAEKLQYDLYYIKNRSLFLDLGIALKTARIALQQSGK